MTGSAAPEILCLTRPDDPAPAIPCSLPYPPEPVPVEGAELLAILRPCIAMLRESVRHGTVERMTRERARVAHGGGRP